jgi:hypothetical protein
VHRGIERDLELLREYSQRPEASRLDIARRVAVVVAWFVRDHEAVASIMSAIPDAEMLEQYVRDHAEDAEGRTLTSGGTISGVLAREYLLDDYLRMKRGEQGMAFDESCSAD